MPNTCNRCGRPIAWIRGYRWPVEARKDYFVPRSDGPASAVLARTGEKVRGEWSAAPGWQIAHAPHDCGSHQEGGGT